MRCTKPRAVRSGSGPRSNTLKMCRSERDAAAAVLAARSGPEVEVQGCQVQKPDRSRNAADGCGQAHERYFSRYAEGHRLGELHLAQHPMAERVWMHDIALTKLRSRRAQDRLSEAAGYDLLSRADLFGELHTGNLQPGKNSTGVVELHRLSRQRG